MTPGTVFSHYRILDRLGQGGMGEVWLAEDLHLGRQVALKILTTERVSTNSGVHRLWHEGRAAAALNHPNIAQVHEIGEAEGKCYLAMEYVEGQTLQELIATAPLPLEKVVDIALQIASALEEAHRKGIVHRDVKPGNVMLTPRGLVKVLDFGLAKRGDSRAAAVDANHPTELLTSPGHVMGTLEYMSPEQCLGQSVDARSDIFSLGVMLYEMLTGMRPFAGSSAAAVYDGILNRQPPPPSSRNPQVPPLMDQLVAKAMEKDRELRYQTVADLRADLQRLRRDSTSGAHPIAAPALPAGGRRLWPPAAIVLGLLALGVAAMLWMRRPPPARVLLADPFTSTTGSETQPSFSPDGGRVAYAWNPETENNWDIYVSLVDAGTPLRLTYHPATDHSPAWSPDGRYILFLRQSDADNSAFILIPSLGGAERRLLPASPQRTGVEAPYAAWLPDGKRVIVADKEKVSEPMALLLVDVDSGHRTRLTSPPAGTYGDSCVVVRPDGKMIYFVRTQSLAVQDIYELPLPGGEPRRLSSDNRRIFGMAWDPVDKLLLFTSARGGSARIWRLAPKSREMSLVAGVGELASYLSLSPNGSILAYTRSMLDTNVWRYPLPVGPLRNASPQPLIQSTRMEQGARYSPDGARIAFASNRSGSPEIWTCDADGRQCRQLTHINQGATGSPFWSPDGAHIAFDARPDGNPDIYVIAAEGGAPRRLTHAPTEEIMPSYSRCGKWIYFSSNRTGVHEVYRMPSDGGAATRMTRQGGFFGVESPDGRYLYYARSLSEPGLYRLPLSGGEEELVLPSLPAGFWAYWQLAGNGVYYVSRRQMEGAGIRYELRRFDVVRRRDFELMTLAHRPFNAGLSLSPDGNWFLYTQVDRSDTDIMVVRAFH